MTSFPNEESRVILDKSNLSVINRDGRTRRLDLKYIRAAGSFAAQDATGGKK